MPARLVPCERCAGQLGSFPARHPQGLLGAHVVERELFRARVRRDRGRCLEGPARSGGGSGGGSTSSAVVTIENRTLRNCAENALVISMLMLSAMNCRRLLQSVVSASRHVLAWHTEQKRRLRSARESLSWLRKQILDGLTKHTSGGLAALASRHALEECGFLMPNGVVHRRTPRSWLRTSSPCTSRSWPYAIPQRGRRVACTTSRGPCRWRCVCAARRPLRGPPRAPRGTTTFGRSPTPSRTALPRSAFSTSGLSRS